MTKKAKKSKAPAPRKEEEADAAAGNLGSFDDDDLVGVAIPAQEDDYDE